MAEKPPEEGYISVVDEEPEILELLKWDTPQIQKQVERPCEQPPEKPKSSEKRGSKQETDPFDLPEPNFIETYRLSKDLARGLIDDLKPLMPETTKTPDFTVDCKVCIIYVCYTLGLFEIQIFVEKIVYCHIIVLNIACAVRQPGLHAVD